MIDVQNPSAVNQVRRRIQDLTVAGDELAVRQHARVVLRGGTLPATNSLRSRGWRRGDNISKSIFSVLII